MTENQEELFEGYSETEKETNRRVFEMSLLCGACTFPIIHLVVTWGDWSGSEWGTVFSLGAVLLISIIYLKIMRGE